MFIKFTNFLLPFLLGIRKDKKLYKPEIIKKWVIVIFESNRFFNDTTVADMISGFILGARGVGKSFTIFS